MGYQSDCCDNEYDQLDAAELQGGAIIMGAHCDNFDDEYDQLDSEDLHSLLAPARILR